MKERPILFSGPLVRAILEGRKTQTRRVIKGIPDDATLVTLNAFDYAVTELAGRVSWFTPWADDLWPCAKGDAIACPYGQPGDRLWVRETHAFADRLAALPSSEVARLGDRRAWYRADLQGGGEYAGGEPVRWRPSIHMPRWASRIDLEVTGVRVERVQDISEDDAKAEGVPGPVPFYPDEGFPLSDGYPVRDDDGESALYPTAAAAFAELWEEINGSRGFGWESNPWVWVVEFRRVR